MMKKYVFMLCMLFSVCSSTIAQLYSSSGLCTSSIMQKTTPKYLGSAEVSGSFGIHHGGFQLITKHGVQFNEHYFFGGGAGLIVLLPYHKYNRYDLDDQEEYYPYVGYSSILMPIFVDFQPTFSSKMSPYLDLKFGGAFGTEIGAYLDFSIGFMPIKRDYFALGIQFGYQLAPARGFNLANKRSYDFYENKYVTSIGIENSYDYSNSLRIGAVIFFGPGVKKF